MLTPKRAPEDTHLEPAGSGRGNYGRRVAGAPSGAAEAARSAAPAGCVTDTSATGHARLQRRQQVPPCSHPQGTFSGSSCPSLKAGQPSPWRFQRKDTLARRTTRRKALDRMSWRIVGFPWAAVHTIGWSLPSAVVTSAQWHQRPTALAGSSEMPRQCCRPRRGCLACAASEGRQHALARVGCSIAQGKESAVQPHGGCMLVAHQPWCAKRRRPWHAPLVN
jgi:hypothetical protein